MTQYRIIVISIFLFVGAEACAQSTIKLSTFAVDASPPIGSPLAYDPTIEIEAPLSCRGVVILSSSQDPIVLCCVDWLGIANEAQTEFKTALAKGAGTTTTRVSIHAVHQHDAPRCDFSAEKILREHGYGKQSYDVDSCRRVIKRAAEAVSNAVANAQPITHLGLGQGKIEMVASNRRILGEDGNVKVTRYTATRDPQVRAMPVGTIDPMLKMISFWNDDQTVAVLTFYATHPQSYYRTGKANPDFPGMARNARQKETGVPHIHFNGAGGNIGAGKWNDGSKTNRPILAGRVEQGMRLAWEQTTRKPINERSLAWETKEVVLPIRSTLDEKELLLTLKKNQVSHQNHLYAAKHLAWLRRWRAKTPIQISCLHIDQSKVLFMPGELFVEYQLAAQIMAPQSFVAMAAYGEYGMGYIGTEIAYSQGGYETNPNASRVGPGSEKILLQAMKELLKQE